MPQGPRFVDEAVCISVFFGGTNLLYGRVSIARPRRVVFETGVRMKWRQVSLRCRSAPPLGGDAT